MISFFSQGRLVWSQAELSQIAFLKVSFSILLIITFIESFWNLSSFKAMRQTCLTRVVSWLSALCLRCWAVPQQCEQPLAVPLKGELGRARAALSYGKHLWPVSWARCSLSPTSGDTSGGSEVKQCTWKPPQVPVTSTLPPQPHPLLPPGHWALGGRQQLTVLGSLNVIGSCLHTSSSSWLGSGGLRWKVLLTAGAPGSSTWCLFRWALY